MDYSLSEALKNTNITGLKRLIAIYDIMCQYWKRLKLRMEESEYVKLPLSIAILHGIGLFHVGGHVWEMFLMIFTELHSRRRSGRWRDLGVFVVCPE